MNGRRSRSLIIVCFFFAVFSLSQLPPAFAQQKVRSEDSGNEASAAQAQATMASLFSRGAKMPSIPHASGTIALPSFDSTGMTIDEGALLAAERNGQRSDTRDRRPATGD